MTAVVGDDEPDNKAATGSSNTEQLQKGVTLTLWTMPNSPKPKEDLDKLIAPFTAKTGVKVNASYAASSTLAKQIEQGAPADIFVSADTDWMDYAVGKKNINESTRVNLLGNSIVLIAPKDSRSAPVSISRSLSATAGSRPAM